MKIKTSIIYLILAAALIIFLVVTANQNKIVDVQRKTMPKGNIHNESGGSTNKAPSKNNVSENVKHQLEAMKKTVDKNPNDTLKLREYADFLAAAHKPDEAVYYYEKILTMNSKRVDILFSLSFIYYNKKDFDHAEKITNKILSVDKNNLQATYNLGALAAGRGEKNRAVEIWERIIKENPGSPVTDLAKESLQRL